MTVQYHWSGFARDSFGAADYIHWTTPRTCVVKHRLRNGRVVECVSSDRCTAENIVEPNQRYPVGVNGEIVQVGMAAIPVHEPRIRVHESDAPAIDDGKRRCQAEETRTSGHVG